MGRFRVWVFQCLAVFWFSVFFWGGGFRRIQDLVLLSGLSLRSSGVARHLKYSMCNCTTNELVVLGLYIIRASTDLGGFRSQTPGRIQKVDPLMGVPIKYP